jgi:hypothetical protein
MRDLFEAIHGLNFTYVSARDSVKAVEISAWNTLITLKMLGMSKVCDSIQEQILDGIRPKPDSMMAPRFAKYFTPDSIENGLYKNNPDDPSEIHNLKQVLNSIHQIAALLRKLEEIPYQSSVFSMLLIEGLPLLQAIYANLPSAINGLDHFFNVDIQQNLDYFQLQMNTLIQACYTLKPQYLMEQLGASLDSKAALLPHDIDTEEQGVEALAKIMLSFSPVIDSIDTEIASCASCKIMRLDDLSGFKPKNKKPLYILTNDELVYVTPKPHTITSVLKKEVTPEEFAELTSSLSDVSATRTLVSLGHLRSIYSITGHYPTPPQAKLKRTDHFTDEQLEKLQGEFDECLAVVSQAFSALRRYHPARAVSSNFKGFREIFSVTWSLFKIVSTALKLVARGKDGALNILEDALLQIQNYLPEYISYLEQIEEHFNLKSGTIVAPLMKQVFMLQNQLLDSFNASVQRLKKDEEPTKSAFKNKLVKMTKSLVLENIAQTEASSSLPKTVLSPHFLERRREFQVARLARALLQKEELEQTIRLTTEFFKEFSKPVRRQNTEHLLAVYQQIKKQVSQFDPNLDAAIQAYFDEPQEELLGVFDEDSDSIDRHMMILSQKYEISSLIGHLRHKKAQAEHEALGVVDSFMHTSANPAEAENEEIVVLSRPSSSEPRSLFGFEEVLVLWGEALDKVGEFIHSAQQIDGKDPEELRQIAVYYKKIQPYLQLIIPCLSSEEQELLFSTDSGIADYIRLCTQKDAPQVNSEIWDKLLIDLEQVMVQEPVFAPIIETEQEKPLVLFSSDSPKQTFFRQIHLINEQLTHWTEQFKLMLANNLSPEIAAVLESSSLPFNEKEYYRDCGQLILYKQLYNALFYLKNGLQQWESAGEQGEPTDKITQTKSLLHLGNGLILNLLNIPHYLSDVVKNPELRGLVHNLFDILKPLNGLPGIDSVFLELDSLVQTKPDAPREILLEGWIESQQLLDACRIDSRWIILKVDGNPSQQQLEQDLKDFCFKHHCDHVLVQTESQVFVVEKMKINLVFDNSDAQHRGFFTSLFDAPQEFFSEDTSSLSRADFYTALRGALPTSNIKFSAWRPENDLVVAQINLLIKESYKKKYQVLVDACDELTLCMEHSSDEQGFLGLLRLHMEHIKKTLRGLTLSPSGAMNLTMLMQQLGDTFTQEATKENRAALFLKWQAELIKVAELTEGLHKKPMGAYSATLYKQTEELNRLLLGNPVLPEKAPQSQQEQVLSQGLIDRLEELYLTGQYDVLPILYKEAQPFLPSPLYPAEFPYEESQYAAVVPVLIQALRSATQLPSISLLDLYKQMCMDKLHEVTGKVVGVLQTDSDTDIPQDPLSQVNFIVEKIAKLTTNKTVFKNLIDAFVKILVKYNRVLNHKEALALLREVKDSLSLILLEAADDSEFHLGLIPGTFSEPLTLAINRFYTSLAQPLLEHMGTQMDLPDITHLTRLQREKDRLQEVSRQEAARIQRAHDAISTPKPYVVHGDRAVQVDNFQRLKLLKEEFQNTLERHKLRLYVVSDREECLLHYKDLMNTFFKIYSELQPYLGQMVDNSFDSYFFIMYLQKPEDFIAAIDKIVSHQDKMHHFLECIDQSKRAEIALCERRIAYFQDLMEMHAAIGVIGQVCVHFFNEWLGEQLEQFESSGGIPLDWQFFADARNQFVATVRQKLAKGSDGLSLIQVIESSLKDYSFGAVLGERQEYAAKLIKLYDRLQKLREDPRLPEESRTPLHDLIQHLKEELACSLIRPAPNKDNDREMHYLKVFHQIEFLYRFQANTADLFNLFGELRKETDWSTVLKDITDHVITMNRCFEKQEKNTYLREKAYIAAKFTELWDLASVEQIDLDHPYAQIHHLLTDLLDDRELLVQLEELGPYKADLIKQMHIVGFLQEFNSRMKLENILTGKHYMVSPADSRAYISEHYAEYQDKIKEILHACLPLIGLKTKLRERISVMPPEAPGADFYNAAQQIMQSDLLLGVPIVKQTILIAKLISVYNKLLELERHYTNKPGSEGDRCEKRLALLGQLRAQITGTLTKAHDSASDLSQAIEAQLLNVHQILSAPPNKKLLHYSSDLTSDMMRKTFKGETEGTRLVHEILDTAKQPSQSQIKNYRQMLDDLKPGTAASPDPRKG